MELKKRKPKLAGTAGLGLSACAEEGGQRVAALEGMIGVGELAKVFRAGTGNEQFVELLINLIDRLSQFFS